MLMQALSLLSLKKLQICYDLLLHKNYYGLQGNKTIYSHYVNKHINIFLIILFFSL